jgi:chromate reductase, NAD(P)H dehydrogenase (quinone)
MIRRRGRGNIPNRTDWNNKENPMPDLHLLAIPGSLRRASFNHGLLRAALPLLPDGVSMEIHPLADIPLYNEDVLTAGMPESVCDFKAKIAAADALLIATPEYNYSIPGVLKNALDWASRPYKENVLLGKPAAIMGAGGVSGSMRAQAALRHAAQGCGLILLTRPEVAVQISKEKFDADGNLTDDAVKERIKLLVEALVVWTRKLKS